MPLIRWLGFASYGMCFGVRTVTGSWERRQRPWSPAPATAWFDLDLDPDFVREGDNLAEAQLTSQRTSEEPVVLDRLDLVVRYP